MLARERPRLVRTILGHRHTSRAVRVRVVTTRTVLAGAFAGQVSTIAAGVGATVKVSPLAPGVGELATIDGH
jgi:hypothetical protein